MVAAGADEPDAVVRRVAARYDELASGFLSSVALATMVSFRLRGIGMLNPAMNDTKWDELRLAMYALTPSPSWSTLSTNGHRSSPDREWFYHFREGGYASILHVDIRVDTSIQRELVRSALRKVHVPGEESPEGFRVFGYLRDGQAAAFI